MNAQAKPGPWVIGDIAVISLTRGLFATIDAADLHLVEDRLWHAVPGVNTFYAVSTERDENGRPGKIQMHRVIMGHPVGRWVDHENGNGLDCRRANLRPATNAENMFNRGRNKNNTSGFKGVSWHRGERKWRARITLDGVSVFLGRYDDAESAFAAYCAAAPVLHGEFARTI